MYDSTLKLSRIGIILHIDADLNDRLFKRGVDYLHKNFTVLFGLSLTDLLTESLDRAFTSDKLQCLEFFYTGCFYQLKFITVDTGHAICIITNNTRHKKVLQDLEDHNMKTLIDTYSDWVWSFDTNFTLITVNKAFLEARRRMNKEVLTIGDSIFKYADDKLYKKWLPIYERVLKGETICMEEKRDNNRVEYYVEIYISPVYGKQHEIIGCLGITRDITERKHTQFAIEGYTTKLQEFAYKTSHGLRKPIANIKGMVDLLSNADLDDAEKIKAINYITISINQLDALVVGMIEMIQQKS